jgi:eukaryotic-like serine/threonine-protein kinase
MTNNLPPTPQRIGKYELRERLGRGGMAEVWKTYDTQLERYVAIKLLHADLQNDPDFMTRFSREARVIASLHHPNIVQIHDFQVTQPSEGSATIPYMVMDYIQGTTLAEYIRTTSRVGKFASASEIIQLFTSISKAIDYAHQHGMIHRDIKPSNILLDKRHTDQNTMGEPILTDFGIAKLMSASGGTISGTWLGTPLYISPEQAQGQPGNERSDIYSLAVILYEMCTGFQPFRGENVPVIMMQHIQSPPPPPALFNPRISPALSMVILRGLAKDPAARFSSASALTAALAEALNAPSSANMNQPGNIPNYLEGPTYLSPIQPPLLPSMTPSFYPSVGTASVGQPATNFASQTPAQAAQMSGPNPINSAAPAIGNQTPSFGLTNLSVTPSPALTPSSGKQRNGLRAALIALAIIVLLGTGLGGLYLLNRHPAAPVVASSQIRGHVIFISSGITSEYSNQGINDELQMDLQNISNPASGMSYYAWLLGDATQPLSPPIFLGKLTVSNGQVHFHYSGDIHHTNLTAITSRFLITEESATFLPSVPSPDQSAWRFYAQLPQTPDSMDMMHEGALQHVRHLLADAPELMSINLPGGLDTWLFRNTEKIVEWAGSARDELSNHPPNTGLLRRQVIRILDYLDGKVYVQQDVPAGTPNLVKSRIAPLAFLEFDAQKQQPPGLLYLIGIHLTALTQAPGVSEEKHKLAAQINQGIKNIQAWLGQVHQDAKQLVGWTDQQLATQNALSVLDDLVANALYAFIGRPDPSTGQIQEGVVQVHYNIQGLVTYDVSPYQSSQSTQTPGM